MSERIFCPLKGKWHRLIKIRRKTWEFRDAKSPVARQLLRHRDNLPMDIELRRGYTGQSLWATADKIIEFSDPFKIPKRVMDAGCVTPDILQTLFDHRPLVGVHFRLTGART
ncbi:unnamed protein product [marine sediment metagenome]|uniref:Uncharacterized protein n=1 Tax=marine sediment metagenome TaxID=412755 RepID=X1PL77_9ZZZZ